MPGSATGGAREPAGRPARDGVPEPVDGGYAEWMGRALALARAAGRRAEVPVGALVVDSAGVVIGQAANAREGTQDPTAHAEVLALRAAARHTGSWRLVGCTLVVTLEPCAMCAGAIVQARVPTLVFGAWDPKAGGCGSVWDLVRDPRANHRVNLVPGVLADECGQVLRAFFHDRRRGSKA